MNTDDVPAVADAGNDVAALGVEELVAYVVEHHHKFVREQAPLIQRHLAVALRVHGLREATVLSALREEIQKVVPETLDHIRREEEDVFPAICRLAQASPEGTGDAGDTDGRLGDLVHEHERAVHELQRLRRLTGNYHLPDGAGAAWRKLYELLQALETDLLEHLRIENELLFPQARGLMLKTGATGREHPGADVDRSMSVGQRTQ